MKTTSALSCNKHENRNLTIRHVAFTFESIHVRSLKIYEYFMVTIISTIFIMKLHALSHKMIFCSFRRVIWLLARCFKLLSFYGRPMYNRADHYIFAL